ncbi:TRAP transporter small permease subunit [Marinomonas spartinae]|uniref:TRAP transporter small permease subunit n=1 Tax=Marinomonas spartinae TaxID=1792290 RepID=UPI0018F2121C|nr:TRAP transporter small permease subunit [Marinomonas spartinae]MBJ7555795.1 TRAP transporter small permease subunit [Marinomonas spartinae]
MKKTIHPPELDPSEVPRNALDRCIYKLGNLLSLLFIFTVAISFYEVVMRYVFDAPTIWVHETASFLGGCLFIYGGIYALATNKHVRVVLIYDVVSDRTKRWLNVFHHIMGLCFTGMLSWAAYQMTKDAWLSPLGEVHLETSGSAWNPAFPALVKAMILLTIGVMFIQFLLHLIQELNGLRKRDHV